MRGKRGAGWGAPSAEQQAQRGGAPATRLTKPLTGLTDGAYGQERRLDTLPICPTIPLGLHWFSTARQDPKAPGSRRHSCISAPGSTARL
jgi:hypothetical protein